MSVYKLLRCTSYPLQDVLRASMPLNQTGPERCGGCCRRHSQAPCDLNDQGHHIATIPLCKTLPLSQNPLPLCDISPIITRLSVHLDGCWELENEGTKNISRQPTAHGRRWVAAMAQIASREGYHHKSQTTTLDLIRAGDVGTRGSCENRMRSA